ncbi:hypothetical protein FOFC_18321 [Fusarium oxysporum]|nr:hypothetical protein FOFC_18321 [Fusarium oxysporum]
MRTIQDLIKQVKAEGFILTKVKPYLANNNTTRFIATETIKKGDVVLQVPYKSAHTTEDISAEIKDKYPDCSAQSYYALEIAKSIRKKERNVWCFLDEVPDKLLRDSIITWPDSLIQALPKQTIRSATDLRAAYKDDWRETESSQKKGGLDIEQEEFKQAWIVAQTRMLACEGSNGEAIQAMLPLAEMFNHASDGCHLDFADNFYEFRATRDYNSGEEITWNDVLLELGLDVSIRTLKRRLQSHWRRKWRSKRRIKLSEEDAKARLKHCEFWLRHLDDYIQICFSDEVTVQNAPNNPDGWVFRRPERDIGRT